MEATLAAPTARRPGIYTAAAQAVPYSTDPTSGLPDGCRRTEAERNALATANFKLIHGYLRRYCRRYANDEDVIQAAWLGLLGAAESYDETKRKPDGEPYSFSNFAYRGIKNFVFEELRSRGVRMASLSAALDAAWPKRADDEPTARELRLQSAWGRGTMPKSDRVLLERRYYLRWSFMRIAAEMGISPARVRQRYKRALRRLRAAMEYAGGLFDMETV